MMQYLTISNYSIPLQDREEKDYANYHVNGMIGMKQQQEERAVDIGIILIEIHSQNIEIEKKKRL